MMLEVFYTNKYDNKIALTDGEKNYTVLELKNLIASEILRIKDKKDNVVIYNEDNFAFIIQFFASVFCGKNIYLITDKARLNDINTDYDFLNDKSFDKTENYTFLKIDEQKIFINFFTSGSTNKPKTITQTLYNIMFEAKALGDEFKIYDENLTVMSTTTLSHRYGLVTHLMFPFIHGLKICTKCVTYPDNVDIENSVLVTTPSFLSSAIKYNLPFKITPKYIFSAGSKLDDAVFSDMEKHSNVIEIYGSTETGDIAYKIHCKDNLTLFKDVKMEVNEDNVKVISDYIYQNTAIVNDKIEVLGNQIILGKRTDRMFKIYEKRVSAEELEDKLKTSKYIENCYITKFSDKLVCLCALNNTGKDYIIDNNVPSLIKNLKQYLLKYSEIIPQKWKFIDEIPKTTMGKINTNLINHIFSVNLSLPVILNRDEKQNEIIYKVLFHKNCNFFNGHFPEFKLVPGVVQIYWAKEFAKAHFNVELGEGQWKRIKFSNIIKPDSIVNLRLIKDEKQVSYEFYSDEKKYASGTFLCENIFEGVL